MVSAVTLYHLSLLPPLVHILVVVLPLYVILILSIAHCQACENTLLHFQGWCTGQILCTYVLNRKIKIIKIDSINISSTLTMPLLKLTNLGRTYCNLQSDHIWRTDACVFLLTLPSSHGRGAADANTWNPGSNVFIHERLFFWLPILSKMVIVSFTLHTETQCSCKKVHII